MKCTIKLKNLIKPKRRSKELGKCFLCKEPVLRRCSQGLFGSKPSYVYYKDKIFHNDLKKCWLEYKKSLRSKFRKKIGYESPAILGCGKIAVSAEED